MRKFIVSIGLLLGVIYFLGRFGEMEAIVETRRSADIRYLLLAIPIQVLWFINLAATFRAIFNALRIKEKLSTMLLLVISANFANTITPAAGMGGMAVFFSEAKRRNYPPGRATVAAVLFVLFDYFGLMCVLLLGLIVLFRRNHLTWTQILASIVFLSIALTLAALLYLGMRSSETLGRVLAWGVRNANRITKYVLKREFFSEVRTHEFARSVGEGLNELRHNPKRIFLPVILSLINKALLLLILLLVFIAFDAPLSIGTLIASFSIGSLFLIVSPTPSGIGFVEGALTLMMYSMYVPLLTARDITLAFRGITLYIPLIVGMFTFRLLGQKVKTKKEVYVSAQD
jgi:glycosyltransferase 2 family protein